MDSENSSSAPPVTADRLSATVQVLTLPPGTYAFTVDTTVPPGRRPQDLAVPALQVGAAPLESEGSVEFMMGADTRDRWLSDVKDIIIAKIHGGPATLLLTSLRSPESDALAVNVQKIDLDADPLAQRGVWRTRHRLRSRVLVHVQNVGDLQFFDGWAGCIGEQLFIEGFAVSVPRSAPADLIEYRGLTAEGFETPWMSHGELCGSRSQAAPLMGYSIRIKPAYAERYTCLYSGRFVSGRHTGPFAGGRLCRSDLPNDPLEGLDIHVAERPENGVGDTSAHLTPEAAKTAATLTG
jgi:hypothetical protein